MAPEPLTGLGVVEVGQYIAAPFAATLFADQGADVVKIERPGGDPYRADPARFAAWNRGKRSVELDLRSPEGRAEARRLIAEADVVIENLRPGALAALGLGLDELRAADARLVTCSISGYGSTGPSRDDPGWEPLVHARAGAQQGMFTAARPIWLPFPMASIGAALLAVIGTGAALVKRAETGYGQHVETSLFDALLFLNAAAIFHREHRRLGIGRPANTPVLHAYETRDGRSVQLNLSGTERWREVCRLVGLDPDGECGLDFSSPESLGRLSDRAWITRVLDELTRRFGERSADEWEAALLDSPAAVAKCNTLEEWLAHEQARVNDVFMSVDDAGLGRLRLAGPPVRVRAADTPVARGRRHGSGNGALGGKRIVDLSSFWAGPLAARLLGELGADVVKVEPPGGEGGYQLMPVLPNIYVDGNRSKRGIVLDLRAEGDRHRLLELVGAADVVVENAVAGTWERLGLGEDALRTANPGLVYARAKGFGLCGPLASRPSFDYVVQAATGMVMTQGGGRPQTMNFTANDYCTGLHLAAGVVLALLGAHARRAGHVGRGVAHADGDGLPVGARGRARRARPSLGRCGRRAARPVELLPVVRSKRRLGDRVRRHAAAPRSTRRRLRTRRRVPRRHRRGDCRIDGRSGVPASARARCARRDQRAPERRTRRPAGNRARPARNRGPPRRRPIRAGRDPAAPFGRCPRRQGSGAGPARWHRPARSRA